MINSYKLCYGGVFFSLLLGLFFLSSATVLATSVDRVSLCNLQGYPGQTIETQITLEGTDLGERSGFWYTNYKKAEGDDSRMDITSWIVIEPKDFTIKQGESKVFTVKVKVPGSAEPGLWGMASKEACQEGNSAERKTYIVFKDSEGGGNVYSGFLIPVSVNVLESQNPLASMINFARENIIIIVLSIIIILLLVLMLTKRTKLPSVSSRS